MTDVKLYTTPYCPFCTQAKNFFSKKGLEFQDFDVSKDPALRKKVSEENNNWRTVPMIIVNDTFIGGFSDLVAAEKSGKLDEIVRSN